MIAETLPPADVADIMADIEITAVVFDRRGNQIRQVITGTKTHATFTYPSKRFRHEQSGDGGTELVIHELHESKVTTLDFLPQPCRVEAEIAGCPVRAFPDYAYVAMDRRPVLGEAKRDWDDFESRTGRVQQAVTRAAASALGWDYEQSTLASIGSPQFRAAVHEVQLHRFAHVPVRAEKAALRALVGGTVISVDDLSHAMTETVTRGLPLICAMMVRRIVEIDLTKPLGSTTKVRLAPPVPFRFPRIRL